MATTTKAKNKKAAPTVEVTLSTFDQSQKPVYRVIRSGKLGSFKGITLDDYTPYGGTPLLDAMVEFIEDMRSRKSKKTVQVGLLLDESGSMSPNHGAVIESVNQFIAGLKDVNAVDPKTAGKGFLVVATDGYENASKKHGYEDVTKLVKDCEKDGWITIFLGAGIDGWDQGRQVGVSGQSAFAQTVSTVNSPQGTKSAMRGMTQSAASYLADSDSYLARASAAPSSSITEDGNTVTSNIGSQAGAAPIVAPPLGAYDPSEAVKKARSTLSE
jgi:hypothetical protein